MELLIREDASKIYARTTLDFQYSSRFWNLLKALNGQIIECDTEYLFKNSFNGICPKEFRSLLIPNSNSFLINIDIDWVEKVIDDERPKYNRCQYCGNKVPVNKTCENGCEEKYLESLI